MTPPLMHGPPRPRPSLAGSFLCAVLQPGCVLLWFGTFLCPAPLQNPGQSCSPAGPGPRGSVPLEGSRSAEVQSSLASRLPWPRDSQSSGTRTSQRQRLALGTTGWLVELRRVELAPAGL